MYVIPQEAAEEVEEDEPILTEDEEAIIAYLRDDEPLPNELLQKLITDWWHQEPFKLVPDWSSHLCQL
jgi:hypothetical protein